MTDLVREDIPTLVRANELPADRHPALVYLARLAPGSRRTMRHALDTVARLVTGGACNALSLDWAQLRYAHCQAIRTRLAETYSPATANKTLAALRGVLREAWRLGLMSAEAHARAVDLEPVHGSRLPRGRALSRGELLALVAACQADQSPAGARDAALLAVLYSGGLRRAEAVGLEAGDFDAEAGVLTIRRGKGNRARTVPIRNGAHAALAAWIAVRGSEPGALFYPTRKGGHLVRRTMTPDAVLKALARRAKAAGIAIAFSPHDLRRSFAGDMLDAGADIATVRALMGHSDVNVTAKYDRRGERAKTAAAELLFFPYGADT